MPRDQKAVGGTAAGVAAGTRASEFTVRSPRPPAGSAGRGPAIGRNVIVSLALCLTLVGSLFATRGQAAAPLSLRLAPPEVIGAGRLRVNATVDGLEPDLHPTIQLSVNVGGRTHEGAPFPVLSRSTLYTVDLPTGAVRVGGVLVDDFAAPPPFDENAEVSFTATVREGHELRTARVSELFLLPTVVVPGYLNDLGGGKMDARMASRLEEKGFRATGAAPTLYWFSYQSRTLSIEAAARKLADYVQTVVLAGTYAARINIVAYSLGGLIARWDLAFEPGWDGLVDRFVMVGVPNEGAVLSYVDAWYPLGGLARTSAARSLLPTFPFWRADPTGRWTVPAGSANAVLARLNTRRLPASVRAYVFYGDGYRSPAVPGTLAGVTGALPRTQDSYGPGDGIVLAASALGLPINGGPGIPGIADHAVLAVDLGSVRHQLLLSEASTRMAGILLDRRVADDAPAAGADASPTAAAPQNLGDVGASLGSALFGGQP